VPDIGEVVRGSCLRAMANNRVQNPKCWAKSLDTCSTKLSREHLITEKLCSFSPVRRIVLYNARHAPDNDRTSSSTTSGSSGASEGSARRGRSTV
jgi:hypothetical protein